MKQRLAFALMLAFGILIVSSVPAFAAEPVVVIDTDKPELGPAASTSYLAWFVWVPGPDAHANVWAQAIGDDAPFRVNLPGSSAFTGGIDGSTLVYQLSEPMDAKPDLAMLDLETRTKLDVPDGVDTPRAEYAPTISGAHLLFGRGSATAALSCCSTQRRVSHRSCTRRQIPTSGTSTSSRPR